MLASHRPVPPPFSLCWEVGATPLVHWSLTRWCILHSDIFK